MYTNLYHVFPVDIDRKEVSSMVQQTSEYFHDRGKTDYTKDEFAFAMTIDRYIEIFEKAKSMVANNKFTVEFKGDKDGNILKIEDFEITPIKQKAG
jgi:hypothetical protein